MLISFGPSNVEHGDTIKFIGTGLDQISEIVMPVKVNVPSSTFITHTSSLIEIIVPQASTVGRVVLKTVRGDSIVSKSLFGAAYAITVRSFTPTTTRPGANITINGNFLNYVKSVTFAQDQSVTEFVSQSIHQLVVRVPNAARTGSFSLTDLAVTPQLIDQDTLKNDLILNVSLPAVTSLSPANGVEQTANLTLKGTDLDLVTQIEFPVSGSSVILLPPFINGSATQITLAVPATAVTGALTLTAPSGVKVTTPSVTVLEPEVTAMSTGKAGVDNVTITGNNLTLVRSIKFPDGTVVASTSFINQAIDGTSIVTAIPSSAIPGTLELVTSHNFTISVPSFKITLPLATSYSSTTPGASTTITGTDLDLVARVIFPDGTSVSSSSFTGQSPTSFSVVVPLTVTSPGTLYFVLASGYQVSQPTFGACSTFFAGGTVLYSFDTNLQGWGGGTYQRLQAYHLNLQQRRAHSCPGAAQLNIPFTAYGQNADVEISPGPPMNFTGKTKLHFWAKVQIPAGTAAAINGVQAFLNTGGYSQYKGNFVSFSNTLADGGSFADGNWHEIIFDIAGNAGSITISDIDQFGVQIVTMSSAPGGGPSVPPMVKLFVDDIWIE